MRIWIVVLMVFGCSNGRPSNKPDDELVAAFTEFRVKMCKCNREDTACGKKVREHFEFENTRLAAKHPQRTPELTAKLEALENEMNACTPHEKGQVERE
ncbi:MAG TPA: hypothetical protein VIU61_06420 [Kofleriaceae bacterium]